MCRSRAWLTVVFVHVLFACNGETRAQTAPTTQSTRPTTTRPAPVVSPEVSPDGHVTFRLMAPHATAVILSAGDIPESGKRPMTPSEGGIWETTVGPLQPGAYRYTFNVDGVPVVDPRSPAISESNATTWSVVVVPGSPVVDSRDVPHGAVAAIHYASSSLGQTRRMHVYTPPGYEAGSESYPVFYLLHGSGDSDDSWTSIGRANFILDNLIADGKAKPMIVVMPAGHVRPTGESATRPAVRSTDFERDFMADIVPYIEKHYRTLADRSHRAVGGLSMGGGQSLMLSINHPTEFAYVGVFSAGLFQQNSDEWEKAHDAQLNDDEARKGLKLFWFKTGKDDFLMPVTRKTVELLKRRRFDVVFEESAGGHTWMNWRDYLPQFATQLFR